MKQYSIVQMVKSVKENRREIVQNFGADYERSARMRYDELTRSYPDEYFELLLIEHNETCLAFTPMKPAE